MTAFSYPMTGSLRYMVYCDGEYLGSCTDREAVDEWLSRLPCHCRTIVVDTRPPLDRWSEWTSRERDAVMAGRH